ncbi:MAG: Methionine aminopeptidase, partial [Phenylobacterium sp.]|nr:Methionine aminopeptidase [Phenylobacterium sp.]
MSSTDILDGDYRSGQIKVHGPADFEGMRVAGKLAAECL